MIPGALEQPAARCSKTAGAIEPARRRSCAGRHAAAPGAARRRAARHGSRTAKRRCTGPPKSAPAQGRARASRASRASSPRTWQSSPTAKGEYYAYREEGAGARHARHPGRGAARPDPQDLLPEDDVLDREGRPALHPADPLDRGAAGRRGGAVRTRRRAVRQRHDRPPAAGRSRRSRSRIANYEQQLRENFVILSAAERRAKIEDGIGALGVGVKPDAGAARNAGLPHRVSRPRSSAASTSSFWRCPKRCWSP